MRMPKRRRKRPPARIAPPPVAGASLTFRAEVMPGRDRTERTFEVRRVLNNGRVELAKMEGEHSLAEFEHIA